MFFSHLDEETSETGLRTELRTKSFVRSRDFYSRKSLRFKVPYDNIIIIFNYMMIKC